MATVVAAVNIDEHQVRQFLDGLFSSTSTGSSTTSSLSTVQAPAPAAAVAPAGPRALTSQQLWQQLPGSSKEELPALQLHPRVVAAHPLGQAHTAQELLDALRLYRQLVQDVHLEVQQVIVSTDKALVTGHQVVNSRLAPWLLLLLPAPFEPEAAAAALKPPQAWLQVQRLPVLHQIVQAANVMLPSLKTGRVPTTIQLRFGRNDAGDPVATHMSVSFSLMASLLPHLALQHWQRQLLDQLQPQLLQAMMAAGSLATVFEDMTTSLSATWRASSAVLSATLGKVLAEVKKGMSSAAGVGVEQTQT